MFNCSIYRQKNTCRTRKNPYHFIAYANWNLLNYIFPIEVKLEATEEELGNNIFIFGRNSIRRFLSLPESSSAVSNLCPNFLYP